MAGEQHPEWLPVDWKVDEKKSFGRKRKVTIERLVADKLPKGWIKEIRTKRVSGKPRKDSFYIEPVTEREFSSMAAVFRYLEAKEGDEDHISADQDDHSQSSPTEAEGQSQIENKEDAEITEHKTAESEHEITSGAEMKEIEKQPDISVEDYLKTGKTLMKFGSKTGKTLMKCYHQVPLVCCP